MQIPVLSAAEMAVILRGCRLIDAELMYKPRPSAERERRVFDFTLASRLTELSRYEGAAVVWIANSLETITSLEPFQAEYPRLRFVAAVVNPEPVTPPDSYADTPYRCEWSQPQQWRRYALTDRWARLLFALEVARQLGHPGYLIMPAHDAVWGRGLLARLLRLSARHAQNGLPAAVSPYTYHQHSVVPGVEIDRDLIDALNAAFARDSWRRWRFYSRHYQAFWGKMGLLPFGLCGEVLQRAETMVWEDDLEIDRVLREAGYEVRGQWIANPALYRQALPVFDRAGLKAVIERTLHYSLNIPGQVYGEKSQLNQPLDRVGQLHKIVSPRFAQAVALSEAIIADCNAEIQARIERCGQSWVDWGAYRYVVRVGDPLVQVWKSQSSVL